MHEQPAPRVPLTESVALVPSQDVHNQYIFTEGIIDVPKIIQTPDFRHAVPDNGKIPLEAPHYKRMRGLYADLMASSGERARRITAFTVDSDLRVGRDNSFRQVFFGHLTWETAQGAAQSTGVAVKPFTPPTFARAMHEAGMMQRLKQEGIPSFDFLGTYVADTPEGPAAFLLSRFDDNADSLDNTNWASMVPKERWQRLSVAVDTLRLLHSKLLFHGDFEIKNVGVRQDGACLVSDMGDAVSLMDASRGKLAMPADVVARTMRQDFGSLQRSITGVLLDGLSDGEIFASLQEHIYTPYQEQLAVSTSPHAPLLRTAFAAFLRQKRAHL